MNCQRMNGSLPIVLLIIVLGFLFFLASPCNAWKTKDPKLAEEYANMLGFKVKDMVGKVAPNIKPGMVIDSSNYKNYPGLKELFPESLYSRLDPGAYAPLAPIKIVETDQYHLGRGWMEKSMESAETIHIGEDGLSPKGLWVDMPLCTQRMESNLSNGQRTPI